MRKFSKADGEYFINGAQVLFCPIVIRWKDNRPDTNDRDLWVNCKQLVRLMNQDDWWRLTICPALPRETMGELDIIDNRHIRPWSLAPDWQLHRGFSIRDASKKLIGTTNKTFDTAIDKEHALLIAKQRLEEIINGKENFLN